MKKANKLKKRGKIHDTLTGYDFRVDEPLTPMKAIRQKCLECCCGSSTEVARCHIHDCTLWPLRSGKTGNKRSMTPEARKKLQDRAKTMRRKAKDGD